MEELVLVEEVLETVAPEAPSLASRLVESLGVAALGMITVFAGLVILIVFITLLTKFTVGGSKKKETKPEVKPVEAPAAAPAAAPAPVDDGTPSPEVVAAISAALAVIMGGEGKFVVRHIKRVQNSSAWNRAGREEQVYSRF